MHSYIRPNEFVVLRLPSDTTKLQKVEPNRLINLGKFGSFPSNQIIGRPYHLTFEILETPGANESNVHLRVVPAAELHAESLITEGEGDDDIDVNEEGMPLRTNREIVDDASTQKLTLAEIEALKRESTEAGQDIIAKLLESHTALDQKTAFSLAKYRLRKQKKYMKRFTVFPLDVSSLTAYMLSNKDNILKIMELRDELIGLLGCWGNVHHGGNTAAFDLKPNGRYLVVDETGGLVLAAMAERMAILYAEDNSGDEMSQSAVGPEAATAGSIQTNNDADPQDTSQPSNNAPTQHQHHNRQDQYMSATGNTITFLHANKQPNTTLLKYFGFDTNSPEESHPLYTNLKTVSWLQLVDPDSDPIYSEEPPAISDEELASLKTNKRGTYYRKRNRWSRVRRVVDETRNGGFDGLIIATLMDPESILKVAVPLLAGGAPVVIYSPTIEPLTEVADLYSTNRKTAYINRRRDLEERRQLESEKQEDPTDQEDVDFPELNDEFPVNPTLLLAPTLETSRIRPWQVLPGRTHPMMSGRGGAEGYIFHGIRVIPTQEVIQAAGNPSRKRRKLLT